MSVAYYIALKDEIPGFDPFVNGKAIAHADEKTIAKYCSALKVKPLTEFISQNPEELADFMEGEGIEAPDGPPEEQWFEAKDGLKTVRALKQYLTDNPTALMNSKAVCDDLSEFETVLERIEKEGVLWHLAVDF